MEYAHLCPQSPWRSTCKRCLWIAQVSRSAVLPFMPSQWFSLLAIGDVSPCLFLFCRLAVYLIGCSWGCGTGGKGVKACGATAVRCPQAFTSVPACRNFHNPTALLNDLPWSSHCSYLKSTWLPTKLSQSLLIAICWNAWMFISKTRCKQKFLPHLAPWRA